MYRSSWNLRQEGFAMLESIPSVLALAGLAVTLPALAVSALLLAGSLRQSSLVRRGLYAARDAACLCFFLLWSLFLALAAAGLTFNRPVTLGLRWAMLLLTVLAVVQSLLEHEWTLLLPGLFALLTLPFFEAAFGAAFPYVLLVVLAMMLVEALWRLVRCQRQLRQQLSLSSIQEAVDSLDDGLLFAWPDGTILLANRIMADLSTSLCRQDLTNANNFWTALENGVSSEFVTKIAVDGSYLFRFTGGNTWTLHRETFPLDGRDCIQIVALNVTGSDNVQRQITVRKAELSRTALQLRQVEATIARLQEEEALVDQGRRTFASITEKMAALNRFFTEHYALPAETFDYKKLAELTAGLLQDLEHAPALTAQQQLELTVSALSLMRVSVTATGALPEPPEAAGAFAHLIREAAVNAVLHGNASAVAVLLEEQEDAWLCRVENDGAPLTGALTPGGGITSIRRQLFPLGGTLEITKEPSFSLQAKIPKSR